ncbi:META domain-containing protein [Bizionia myxarmorum]|uniref:META domain-containing protein n=1 Tax=Bizionia myxarmorum TaxID=291186 RepID=UPI001FEC9A62|nr:META domain-containing protein [Bizionia myxarmorum]
MEEEVFIENTKWVISRLEVQDMTNAGESDQDIHFMLNSKTMRVSGFSGCNTFMGTYKLEDGNRISFSELGSTRMACPDSKIDEAAILSVFETADNFRITNNTLELNKAKMTPLAIFKKSEMHDNPITEKYWKLKILGGKEVKMADNQEREIYFMLKTNESQVTGFAGCNQITGAYTLEDGNRIRFSNMGITLKACPDVVVDESQFLKVFELADNYTITDDVLSLNVAKRAPLAVFEAIYFD